MRVADSWHWLWYRLNLSRLASIRGRPNRNGLAEDCRGQDLIEYALLAAFLTVAVAAIFPPSIAPSISAIFSKVITILDSAPPQA